jgi:hypothetical protein
MLRLIDRVGSIKAGAGATAEETEAFEQFMEHLPPRARQRTLNCLEEAGRAIAAMRAKGQERGSVSCSDTTKVKPPDIAEEYIADCSDQLARVSAVAAMPDMEYAEPIVRLWHSNLEFMKWWLGNYRQKTGSVANPSSDPR